MRLSRLRELAMTNELIEPPKKSRHGAPSPRPLDYQTPAADPNLRRRVAQFICGLILSMGSIGYASANLFLTTYVFGYGTNGRSWHVVEVYAFIAVVGILGCVMIKGRLLGGWRWFVLGLLIGTGLTGLLAGICFTAASS
jgi:hypothetical protein